MGRDGVDFAGVRWGMDKVGGGGGAVGCPVGCHTR